MFLNPGGRSKGPMRSWVPKSFGIGIANPQAVLEVARSWPSVAGTNLMASFASYGDQARFVIRRANGTLGNPTALSSGDNIGQIGFRGFTSAGAFTAGSTAQIVAGAEENFTGTNAGTNLAFLTAAIGSLSAARRLFIGANGSVVVGSGAGALATNATDGFLYIPTCAGTPTGVPAAQTGSVAIVYDTANNKFYAYNGAWKGGTNPGAFT